MTNNGIRVNARHCLSLYPPLPLQVLLPVSVVFPDGSALMPAGSLSIAHAAARHAVPVYGLAAFYKVRNELNREQIPDRLSLPMLEYDEVLKHDSASETYSSDRSVLLGRCGVCSECTGRHRIACQVSYHSIFLLHFY